jgi:hypothetical protein
MKQMLFFALVLSVISVSAQEQPSTKRISMYAGLSPYLTPVDNGTGYNAPGIQHEFRHNPLVFGAEFSKHWRGNWHYFAAAQGALNVIQGRTAITPPQALPPSIVRVESQSGEAESFQIMLGGGLQAQLLEKKWFLLRAQLGAMAAYVQDRNEISRGISLMTERTPGEFVSETGGTAQHEIIRQVIPVGRAGLGFDVTPGFAKGFSFGLDAFYLISPRFMEGSWTRNDLNNTLATSGSYEMGWNNMILAGRISYRWE